MGGSIGSSCTLKNFSNLFFIEGTLMISLRGIVKLIFSKALSKSKFKSLLSFFGKAGLGRSLLTGGGGSFC
jgi:hypothetical protein